MCVDMPLSEQLNAMSDITAVELGLASVAGLASVPRIDKHSCLGHVCRHVWQTVRVGQAQEIKLNLHETQSSYREQAKQNEMLLDLLAQQAAKVQALSLA